MAEVPLTPADRYDRALAEHLDTVLAAAGCHCLHGCAWPTGDRADLNHVVIGPAGVFVIDDKYLSHEIRRGTDGRVWSGGSAMDPDIDRAADQAAAVAALLGAPVTAVMALHGSRVNAMPVVRGVHLFAAGDVPAFLQRRQGYQSPAVVANLAAKATALLRPAASTQPRVVPRPGASDAGRRRGHSRNPSSAAPGVRRAAANRGLVLGIVLVIVLAAVAIGTVYLR